MNGYSSRNAGILKRVQLKVTANNDRDGTILGSTFEDLAQKDVILPMNFRKFGCGSLPIDREHKQLNLGCNLNPDGHDSF